MQITGIIIFILLGAVSFGLAVYLGILLNKLRLQKKSKDDVLNYIAEKNQKRIEDIYESLRIIALAVIQDQCEISEGCIRIKKLIDLTENLKEEESLAYIHKAYDDFEQFPFLEERKKLSKQEKFRQDNRRFELEKIHMESIKKACEKLLDLLKTGPNSWG